MNIRPFAVLLALAAGCVHDASADAPRGALDGYWNVDSQLSAGDCDAFGSVSPVEPGMVEVFRGEQVEIGRPGAEPRLFEDHGSVFTWRGATRVEGCNVEADAFWQTLAVSPTGFQAEVHVDVRADGRRCDAPSTCSATYVIRGRR